MRSSKIEYSIRSLCVTSRHDRQCSRLETGADIARRRQRRRPREAALGEERPNRIPIGVGSCGETASHVAIASNATLLVVFVVHQRAVGQPTDRLPCAAERKTTSTLDEWGLRARRRAQHPAQALRSEGVDDDAFPCAGDAREDAGRVRLQSGLCRLAGDERQRHEIAFRASVGVLDRCDREERGRQATPERRPVGEAQLPDLARLRGEPSLPLEKGTQGLAFEDRARAAVEHVLPVDAHQQRRHRFEDGGVRIHGRCRPGRHQHGIALQREPVRRVGAQRQEIRRLADPRELGEPAHFRRNQPGERLQIELRRLDGAREVDDDEDRFVVVAAQVPEHLPVRAADELERAAAEDAVLLAHRDQPLHPVQRRERRPFLGFDVDRLVAVDRILNRGRVEPGRIGP